MVHFPEMAKSFLLKKAIHQVKGLLSEANVSLVTILKLNILIIMELKNLIKLA